MVKPWVVLHFQAARNAGHTDGVGNCVTWQMPLSRPGSSFRVLRGYWTGTRTVNAGHQPWVACHPSIIDLKA